MNRFFQFNTKLLTILLVSFGAIASASGQLTTSADPPTENLLTEALSGAIFSRIFSEAGNANHARGQLFALEAGVTEITAITIRKSATQTFNNDSLTIRLFEGNNDQWITGTGHTTAANGMDFFVGTTVTPLSSETFGIDGEFLDDDYLTFTLATPVQVSEGDYGFLITYEPSNTVTSPVFFEYLENQDGTSGRIAVTDTSHASGTGVRGFNFAVIGQSDAIDCLKGDVGLSGDVSFDDIGPFIAALALGEFQCEADVDNSGMVNFDDIGPFIAVLADQ